MTRSNMHMFKYVQQLMGLMEYFFLLVHIEEGNMNRIRIVFL
jgi:hypothetical protein